MSWTRRFIYAFWAFVIIMLLWEAYQYNNKVSAVDPLHPTQKHFYFIHTNAHATVAAPVPAPPKDGPDVRQTSFTIKDNTPGNGSFTCYVTLKNRGKARAVNVQAHVRPYHGASTGDEDVGSSSLKPIADASALAQVGDWVDFPDLAPGESSTQTRVFIRQSGANFGNNSPAEIIFEPEKK